MQKIIIDKKYENKKLDKVISMLFPKLSYNSLCKAFRKKDIRVNGNHCKSSYIVASGDVVSIYIIDAILFGKTENSDMSHFFDIVYQDDNLLIVNKMQGISVHNDSTNDNYTLINIIRKNLALPNAMLCHRLDRNTGGLILIAKNIQTLDLLTNKIKNNEIKKYYKCLVYGNPHNKKATLHGYLFKNKKLSRVFIKDTPSKNTLEIITRYKLLSTSQNTSLLEIELLTGRTHQIRAHMSHIGLPIIGDGKYGMNKINKQFSYKFQALWAYKVIFKFSDNNHLSYLNNKVFEVVPNFV